ncbi:MAG: hypothetical protein R3190_01190 [Thermoanaerobaculia bacterium]|nr:hypothetical protein [Thermoanaerobaculia bacterium]
MAQLLVRGLDREIVRRLKIRAARNGRSAEAEHRQILASVLGEDPDDFWLRAARLREATRGRARTDSALLLRRLEEGEP